MTLVTGATGLIGSHVARALVDRGDAVRVTVRATSNVENLEGLEVERVRADLPALPSRRRHRLAEAAAEWLHLQVRTNYWGYANNEALTNNELIAEKYIGIRPAPGYPACPDHTAKRELFALLDAPANAGMQLTESCAMTPAAAVSGFYIGHPAAQYFAIPKIGRDQLEDWARRKGMSTRDAEYWLAPLL